MNKLNFKDTSSANNAESLSQPAKMPLQPGKRSLDQQDLDHIHSSTHKKMKEIDVVVKTKESPAEPPKKISFGLSQKTSETGGSKIGYGGFKMGVQKPASQAPIAGIGGGPKKQSLSNKPKVASAFVVSEEDDDEDEEMPPEAKMRMKNIGRNTPTSAGPNSFGKGRMGFCDSKKLYERQLKESQDKSAVTAKKDN